MDPVWEYAIAWWDDPGQFNLSMNGQAFDTLEEAQRCAVEEIDGWPSDTFAGYGSLIVKRPKDWRIDVPRFSCSQCGEEWSTSILAGECDHA